MHVLKTATIALAAVCVRSCYERPPKPVLGYENDEVACIDGRDNDKDGVTESADQDCVAFNSL